MSYNHWNSITECYKAPASDLHKGASHSNSINIRQNGITAESIQSYLTNLEQHTDLLLDNVNNLIQIILHLVHELQASQVQPSDEANGIGQDLLVEEAKADGAVYENNDNIFAELNEFIIEYNQHRDIAHQISGYAVTRCFIDNIMDYTDFGDLNRNLKRYGIPAGAVRKLWRFLNPVERNVNEQDNQNVVVLPIGSYSYIPSVFNDNEYIDFEIGKNLSVPSDWSDDDE